MIKRGFISSDFNENGKMEKIMVTFDKILKLAMKADLDLKNKIESFSSVLLVDPFNQAKSLQLAESQIISYDFAKEVYPSFNIKEILEATKEKRNIKPPKCIFLPSREIVRAMIRAIMKWGNSDTEEAFFLRFGLLDEPNWYFKQNN